MSTERISGQGVYILELSEPLGNERHSARYYVGWTSNVEGRLWYHEGGHGAAFTRAAVERGITLKIVVWIPGAGRDVERRIKRQKNTARFVAQYLRSTTAKVQ